MRAISLFTKIINGEIPAHRVWEDDAFVAFLDSHPVQRGHVLLVPTVEVIRQAIATANVG